MLKAIMQCVSDTLLYISLFRASGSGRAVFSIVIILLTGTDRILLQFFPSLSQVYFAFTWDEFSGRTLGLIYSKCQIQAFLITLAP